MYIHYSVILTSTELVISTFMQFSFDDTYIYAFTLSVQYYHCCNVTLCMFFNICIMFHTCIGLYDFLGLNHTPDTKFPS